MIPQPPIPILIPSSWDSDSDSGVYQILWFRFWFRFQRFMIPIPTPIPGFPKNFDSDFDSRVTGFWFRFQFQGFPNSMIPIPILIPVIHDSDSNSDSRDSHIFWFRFHVSDFDSNFDSNFDSTVVLTIPTSIQWRFGNITGYSSIQLSWSWFVFSIYIHWRLLTKFQWNIVQQSSKDWSMLMDEIFNVKKNFCSRVCTIISPILSFIIMCKNWNF